MLIIFTTGVPEGQIWRYKNIKYQVQKFSYTSNQKSMIPHKVQYPLPTYRIGAISVGGTHKGKKLIIIMLLYLYSGVGRYERLLPSSLGEWVCWRRTWRTPSPGSSLWRRSARPRWPGTTLGHQEPAIVIKKFGLAIQERTTRFKVDLLRMQQFCGFTTMS